MTTEELDELDRDFEAWRESFHRDILEQEFKKIALIVATTGGSLANVWQNMEKFKPGEIQENLFDINTDFFCYTIYQSGNDNYYLMSEVDVYCIGGDQIGTAECHISKYGEFICKFTER